MAQADESRLRAQERADRLQALRPRPPRRSRRCGRRWTRRRAPPRRPRRPKRPARRPGPAWTRARAVPVLAAELEQARELLRAATDLRPGPQGGVARPSRSGGSPAWRPSSPARLAVVSSCPVCGSADHPHLAQPTHGRPDAAAEKEARRLPGRRRDRPAPARRSRSATPTTVLALTVRAADGAELAAAAAGLERATTEHARPHGAGRAARRPRPALAEVAERRADAQARRERAARRRSSSWTARSRHRSRRRPHASPLTVGALLEPTDCTDLAALRDAARVHGPLLRRRRARPPGRRRSRGAPAGGPLADRPGRPTRRLQRHPRGPCGRRARRRAGGRSRRPCSSTTPRWRPRPWCWPTPSSRPRPSSRPLIWPRSPRPLPRPPTSSPDGEAAAELSLARSARLDTLSHATRSGARDAGRRCAPSSTWPPGWPSFVDGRSPDNRLQMRLSAYVLAYRLRQVVAAANDRLAGMSDRRYSLEHTGPPRRRRDPRRAEPAGARRLVGRGPRPGDAVGRRDVRGLAGAGARAGRRRSPRRPAAPTSTPSSSTRASASLDADTLDDVMDTLDSLRDGGRVVGVVSHVAEMQRPHPHPARGASRVAAARTAATGQSPGVVRQLLTVQAPLVGRAARTCGPVEHPQRLVQALGRLPRRPRLLDRDGRSTSRSGTGVHARAARHTASTAAWGARRTSS